MTFRNILVLGAILPLLLATSQAQFLGIEKLDTEFVLVVTFEENEQKCQTLIRFFCYTSEIEIGIQPLVFYIGTSELATKGNDQESNMLYHQAIGDEAVAYLKKWVAAKNGDNTGNNGNEKMTIIGLKIIKLGPDFSIHFTVPITEYSLDNNEGYYLLTISKESITLKEKLLNPIP